MKLMTIDEINREIAATACHLVTTVDAPRIKLAQLLTRRGSLAGLKVSERHEIADYWALIDELVQLGHDGLVADQLEGILSVVQDPDVPLSTLDEFAQPSGVDEIAIEDAA